MAAILAREANNRLTLIVRMNQPVDASTLGDLRYTVRASAGAWTPAASVENGTDVVLGSWAGQPPRQVTVELSNRSSSAGLRSERGAHFQQEYADVVPTGIFSRTAAVPVIAGGRTETLASFSPSSTVILRQQSLAVHRLDTAAALAISNVTAYGSPVDTFHVSHASHSGDVYLTIAASARWYLGHDGALILPWGGTRTESEADLTATVVPANGGVSGGNYPSISGSVQNTIRNLPSGIWVMYPASWDRIAAAAPSLFTVGTDRTIKYEANTRLYGDALTADDGWAVEMASDTNAYHTGPNLKHASGRDRLGTRTGGMRLLVTVPGASYGLGTAYRGTSNPVVIHPDSELHWFGVEIVFIDNNDVNSTSNLYGIAMANALSDVDLTIRSTPREPGDPTFRVMRARFGRMAHGAGRRLDITLVDTMLILDDVLTNQFAPSNVRQVEGANRGGTGHGAALNALSGSVSGRQQYYEIANYSPSGASVTVAGGYNRVPVSLLNPTLPLSALNANASGTRVRVDVEVTCVDPLGAAVSGVPVIVRNLVDDKYGADTIPSSAVNAVQREGTATTAATGRATVRRVIWSAVSGRSSLTDGTSARIRVRDARYTLVDRAVTLEAAGVNRFTVQVTADADAPAALPSGASVTINGGEKEVAVNGNVSMSPRQLYGLLKRDLPADVLPFFRMTGTALVLDADWDVRFSIPRTSGLRAVSGDTSNRLTLSGTGAYDGTTGDGIYVTDSSGVTVRLTTTPGARVIHSPESERVRHYIPSGAVLQAYDEGSNRQAADDVTVPNIASGESIVGLSFMPDHHAFLVLIDHATAPRVAAVTEAGRLLGTSALNTFNGRRPLHSICYIRFDLAVVVGGSGVVPIDPRLVLSGSALPARNAIAGTAYRAAAWNGSVLVLARAVSTSMVAETFQVPDSLAGVHRVGSTLTVPFSYFPGGGTQVNGLSVIGGRLYVLSSGGAIGIGTFLTNGSLAPTLTYRNIRRAGASAYTGVKRNTAGTEVSTTAGADGTARISVAPADASSMVRVTVKKEGYDYASALIAPSVPDHAIALSRNEDIDLDVPIDDYDLTSSGGATKNVYAAPSTDGTGSRIYFSDTYDLKASPEKSKRVLDAVLSTEDGVRLLHRYATGPSPNNNGRVVSFHPTFVNILPGWVTLARKASLPAESRAVFGIAAYIGDDATYYRPQELNGGHVEVADPTVYVQFDTPRIRTVSRTIIEEPANREAIGAAVWDKDVSGYTTEGQAGKELLDAQGGGGGGGGLTNDQAAAIARITQARADAIDRIPDPWPAAPAAPLTSEQTAQAVWNAVAATYGTTRTMGAAAQDSHATLVNSEREAIADAVHERLPASDDPANSLGQRIRSMDSEIGNLHTRLTQARAGYLDSLATRPARVADLPSVPTAAQNATAVWEKDISSYADGTEGVAARELYDAQAVGSGGGGTGLTPAQAAAIARITAARMATIDRLGAGLTDTRIGYLDASIAAIPTAHPAFPAIPAKLTDAEIRRAVWSVPTADLTGLADTTLGRTVMRLLQFDSMGRWNARLNADGTAGPIADIAHGVWNFATTSPYFATGNSIIGRIVLAIMASSGRLTAQRAGYIDNLSTRPARVADLPAAAPTAAQNADAVWEADEGDYSTGMGQVVKTRASQSSVSAIPTTSPAFPSAAAVATAVVGKAEFTAAAKDARIARKMLTNRQVRDPTASVLTTYDDDGTTTFRTQALKARDGSASAGAEAFEKEAPPQAADEDGQ